MAPLAFRERVKTNTWLVEMSDEMIRVSQVNQAFSIIFLVVVSTFPISSETSETSETSEQNQGVFPSDGASGGLSFK
jgi:hypothetical protein